MTKITVTVNGVDVTRPALCAACRGGDTVEALEYIESVAAVMYQIRENNPSMTDEQLVETYAAQCAATAAAAEEQKARAGMLGSVRPAKI